MDLLDSIAEQIEELQDIGRETAGWRRKLELQQAKLVGHDATERSPGQCDQLDNLDHNISMLRAVEALLADATERLTSARDKARWLRD